MVVEAPERTTFDAPTNPQAPTFSQTVHITISPQMVDNSLQHGGQRRSHLCPIALASRAAFKRLMGPDIFVTAIRVGGGSDAEVKVTLGEQVAHYLLPGGGIPMTQFDQTGEMQPFEADLNCTGIYSK